MDKAILFVCLGNICRSPTAEAVFRQRASEAGLLLRLRIDSAGTGSWHVGEPPDQRACQAASRRGYDMRGLYGRQVSRRDFDHFDYILAMDQANLSHLLSLRPDDYAGHLGLFLDFQTDSPLSEVPDPYYGGKDGFDQVLDLIEAASEGLLARLREQL